MLKLPSLFSNHLVLQRGQANPVWGLDTPGQVVTLTISGVDVSPVSATADDQGAWQIACPELPTGGPYRITLSGSSSITIDDVLVGEVWLASGQSNMEWAVSDTHTAQEDIAAANAPHIRLFHVPNRASFTVEQDVDAAWEVCAPQTVATFSAVAYHFGRELHEQLGVPVGLIEAAWGGTRVEAWASADALRSVMDLDAELDFYPKNDDDLRRYEAEYQANAHEWEMANLPADPGNTGVNKGWAAPDLDDSAWPRMPVPGMWQRHGLNHNGVVWFRQTIDLPDQWRGQALTLRLGVIDDFDTTYVNGVEIGSHPKGVPAAYTLPREYTVPATLTNAGRVVIAVRVFDHYGQGGFASPEHALTLAPDNGSEEAISLAGVWRCQVEHAIPTIGVEVFATYPPQPYMLLSQNRPEALFNGMIAPLIPYGLRGAIWYQGESNAEQHATYRERFTAMIRDWRRRWAQPVFPFLFVQLANFLGGPTWPYLREAQAQTLSEPDTGMAVTIDIGDPTDIHPRNKREVGRRLSLIARANVYGQQVEYAGPTFESLEVLDGELRLRFAHAHSLQTSDGGPIEGFELAGADQVFHAAEARIEGETITLYAQHLDKPVALRYAWRDSPRCNLVNKEGLPAAPFHAVIEHRK